MEDRVGWCNERKQEESSDALTMPMTGFRKKEIITIILFYGLLILASVSCHGQIEKEKEAIKALITRETSAFLNVDRKGWSESWVQSPYAYWSYGDSTGSNFLDGWENINKTFDTYFKTQKPSLARLTDLWIDIRVYGNAAYARFIQKIEDNIDVEETSQVRVLEKKDGKWKVVCVGVVAKYSKK